MAIDGDYPCGGAFGCGHRVGDHGQAGCTRDRCPCEFTPEDWATADSHAREG